MSDPAGIPFGAYRLIRRLARGGMAEVFLARQTGLEGFDRLCALKRILPHLASSREFVDMFFDEARLAAQLRHPNVVHIYDFGKVDEAYFIAMEYVDGVAAGDLIARAASEPLPFSLVARIGASAGAGLDHAHNLRDVDGNPLALVHRDVSPPNLLVSYEGGIKLVDFGIAKAESSIESTRPGVVKGKHAYMSPEQTLGKALDGRSDVFSLGIVLWELLAGRPAVRRDDPIEGMKQIRDGAIPPIEAFRPDVPAPLVRALGGALARDPGDRASALELALALERYIQDSSGMSSLEVAQWLRTRFPPADVQPSAGPGPTRLATAATGVVALKHVAPSAASAEEMRTEISPPLFAEHDPFAARPRDLAPPVVNLKPRRGAAIAIAVAAVVIAGLATAFAVSPGSHPLAADASVRGAAAPVDLAQAEKVSSEADMTSVAPAAEATTHRVEAKPPSERDTDGKTKSSSRVKEQSKSASSPKADASGKLRLRAIPYAEVYLGGKRLGVTPFEVSLPAGKHRLRFVNPEIGVERTRQVTIKAGETERLSIELEK